MYPRALHIVCREGTGRLDTRSAQSCSKRISKEGLPKTEGFIDISHRVDILSTLVLVDFEERYPGIHDHAEDNSDNLSLLLGRPIASKM